ncbi:hypothetical protein [Streptomyces ossamyceticus]|uniref:Peptidase inhibitor family I36 n=1 Tax=Streptomyces ossamyceticus TaxID=249581 RepID=A0ABV2V593_9ACTN
MSPTFRMAAAVCATALSIGFAGSAHAADDGRQYVGFVAPATAQSVVFQYKGSQNTEWATACFRWPGGTNTGKPASALNGLEAWNSYSRAWVNADIWSKPFRTWSVRAELRSGGQCDGAKVGERQQLSQLPSGDNEVHWFDFR